MGIDWSVHSDKNSNILRFKEKEGFVDQLTSSNETDILTLCRVSQVSDRGFCGSLYRT